MTANENVLGMIADNNIKFIRLQFVDVLGIVKNVAIPAAQMKKALDVGISFDGSSIEGFARIQESDMVLYYSAGIIWNFCVNRLFNS